MLAALARARDERATFLVQPELALVQPELALVLPELALVLPELALVLPELALVLPELALVLPELALVLPELALSPRVLAAAQADLAAASVSHPILTVAGLCHLPVGGAHVKEAVALGPDSTELYCHRMLTRHRHERLKREATELGSELVVLPTPVGNVAVAFCLDAFHAERSARWRRSHASILLVPSLSDRISAHERAAGVAVATTKAGPSLPATGPSPPVPVRRASGMCPPVGRRRAVLSDRISAHGRGVRGVRRCPWPTGRSGPPGRGGPARVLRRRHCPTISPTAHAHRHPVAYVD